MKTLDYDNQDWSAEFYLCTKSPSGLAWNKTVYSAYGKKLEIWPGKPAGTLKDVKNGDNLAWEVASKISGKSHAYKVHRIVLCLLGKSVNGKVVDHINGVSADNSYDNLRITTQAINSRNCTVQWNSPYGINGVGFQQDGKGNDYFIARWYDQHGKRVQESFPIKKFGVMEAFKRATQSRESAILFLNSIGMGYTNRHTERKQNAK